MNHFKNQLLKTMCRVFFIGVLILIAGLVSCKTKDQSRSHPAKKLFERAQTLKKKAYYNEALTVLNKLKSRYLYSPYFKKASLMVADIYFLQGQWEKASVQYILFSKRHIKHPQIDRVFYQIGRSFFYQLPTTPDRDLSLSKKALDYFKKQIRLFPKSPYQKKSKAYRKKIKQLLAKNQWMIAKFHIQNNRLKSSLPYLKTIAKKFKAELKNEKTLPPYKKIKTLLRKARKAGGVARKANRGVEKQRGKGGRHVTPFGGIND